MQQQNPDKAVKALKKALSFDPQFIQAHTTLGSAYLALGDPDGCIMQCSKALEIEPMFGPAYNNIGLAYLDKGEPKKAIMYFDKAVETGFEVEAQVLEEIKQYR
jgi:Tfp pilus assembly protein PilF